MFIKYSAIAFLSLNLISQMASAANPWEELVNDPTLRSDITKAPAHPKSVQMGVIDSGFDTHHPALHNNFAYGFNVRDRNFDVQASMQPTPSGDRPTSHGTHVGGTLEQMNDTSEIVPIKCGRATNMGIALQGLEKAKEMGVSALNISLSIRYNWSFCMPLLLDLAKAGTMISVSAGNEGEYLDDQIITVGSEVKPLSDWLKEAQGRIVLVGATERVMTGLEDVVKLAHYSQKCPEALKPYYIAAPGSNILSTVPHNKFEEKSGTSMAAPVFLGALVRLATVFDVSLDRAREILFSTAVQGDTRSDGVRVVYTPDAGQGMVDFAAAWHVLEREKFSKQPKPLTLKQISANMPVIYKGRILNRNDEVEYKRRNGLGENDTVTLSEMINPHTAAPMSLSELKSSPINRAYRQLPILKVKRK